MENDMFDNVRDPLGRLEYLEELFVEQASAVELMAEIINNQAAVINSMTSTDQELARTLLHITGQINILKSQLQQLDQRTRL